MARLSSNGHVRYLGVLSDTHGDVLRTRQAAHIFNQMEVDVVLHCGDIGSPEIPPLLADCPAHFVFGNTDRQTEALRAAIEQAGSICHDRFAALTLAGRRIALLHGDDWRALGQAAGSGQYDLVCYGHTHRFKEERVNNTLILNPGAVYRAGIPSVVVVDLPTLDVMRIPICG